MLWLVGIAALVVVLAGGYYYLHRPQVLPVAVAPELVKATDVAALIEEGIALPS